MSAGFREVVLAAQAHPGSDLVHTVRSPFSGDAADADAPPAAAAADFGGGFFLTGGNVLHWSVLGGARGGGCGVRQRMRVHA